MTDLLLIIVSTIFVNNFILSRFLGVCPFLGVSRKVETAFGMGVAVLFVMTTATAVTYVIQKLILVPKDIQYLQTVSFIVVIASLVQFVEIVLKKFLPSLYQALGIFLPLITTNCAVLGCAILVIQKDYTFIQSMFFAIGSAIGFTMAIVIFAGIRDRLKFSAIPKIFRQTPITLITAGILSLAFMGFTGLIK